MLSLIRLVLFATCLAMLPLGAGPVIAQSLPGGETPEATPAPDAFERETPRSAVTALLRALAEQDYTRAGQYFAMPADAESDAATKARALQVALDKGGQLKLFAELSNDPAGFLDDGLDPGLERIGVLPAGDSGDVVPSEGGMDEGEPILLRLSEDDGIWQIAESTTAALSEVELSDQAVSADDEAILISGAPLTDWLRLLAVFVGLFLAFRLTAAAILWAFEKSMAKPRRSAIYRFLHAALPPFSLLLAVVIFQIWGNSIAASLVARQIILRYIGIAGWIALAWLALRLIDAVAYSLMHRMERAERRQAVSVVTLARRAAKLILLVVAFVAILDTLGIDVTTGIAALGIGGIALALGAQKTIENLVGSVMVIADKPIQVGDFCRVGEVKGTVEDIGMRSTRIRTNERTVVAIPNGDFSSLQIENYTQRDKFLFNVVIGLEYALSAEKLREAIRIIEQVLEDDARIADDPRAKLANFSASSLDVEIFAYIDLPDYIESLSVRQDLLLDIYSRLEAAGIGIAYPTSTMYLRPELGAGSGEDRQGLAQQS
ncbi:mechanosensitive ion channel family protein [Pseudopontixanthobacter vadosimaris]|uniref:mechanosensitive ion channel family protein n=1 Tax=Pseudopontixanthobacter vadosimaris TaxID=2726450 RepID=UPI001473396F|nr:mechanosensitive ion channel family protein [Pseudopontixanthobacter vadosimaris]